MPDVSAEGMPLGLVGFLDLVQSETGCGGEPFVPPLGSERVMSPAEPRYGGALVLENVCGPPGPSEGVDHGAGG